MMKQPEREQVEALINALNALRLTQERFQEYRTFFSLSDQDVCMNFLHTCTRELFLFGRYPELVRVQAANEWIIQLAHVRHWMAESVPTKKVPAISLGVRLAFTAHNQDTDPRIERDVRQFKR